MALLAQAVSLALGLFPVVLDPLPRALGPLKFPSQAFVLLPQPLGLALTFVPRGRLPPRRHSHGSKKAYPGPWI